jgi:hypothetical protein
MTQIDEIAVHFLQINTVDPDTKKSVDRLAYVLTETYPSEFTHVRNALIVALPILAAEIVAQKSESTN